jgi:peptidoglycan/LPS O-acetylase OafA/YrhL
MKIGFIISLISAVICGAITLLILFGGINDTGLFADKTTIFILILGVVLLIIYTVMAVLYRRRNPKILFWNIGYLILIGLFYFILPKSFGFDLGWHIAIALILALLTLINYKKLNINYESGETN